MIDIQETETEYLLTIPQEQKARAKTIKPRDWDWKLSVWRYPRTTVLYDALIDEFGDDLSTIAITRPALSSEDKPYSSPEDNTGVIQNPTRRIFDKRDASDSQTNIQAPIETQPKQTATEPTTSSYPKNNSKPPQAYEPKECRYRIQHGDVGFSYERIFGDYLFGCEEIVVEDAYIRSPHQITNFLRFCETVVRIGKPKRIKLITKGAFRTQLEKDEAVENLDSIAENLKHHDVDLEIEENANLHDRLVSFSNGWVIEIGRGLDIYQKPDNWMQLGVYDLGLRPCRETNVNVIRLESI